MDTVPAYLYVTRKVIHQTLPLFPHLSFNHLHVLLLGKELHKRLLENVPASRSPPEYFVRRARAIYCRLRTNRPPPSESKFFEVREDRRRLGGQWRGGEWRGCCLRMEMTKENGS
jgi:hypothetical protein